MNKKDLPLLVALVGLWLAWPHIYNKFFKKPAPPPVETSQSASDAETAVTGTAPGEVEPELAPASDAEAEETTVHPLLEEEAVATGEPEEEVVLEDDAVRITLSSHGATVRHAMLKNYSESVDPESGPVELHFDESPALGYRGLPGLGAQNGFAVTPSNDGLAAVFKRTSASGLTLVREVILEGNYLLRVIDTYTSTQASMLPEHGLSLGGMGLMPFENKPARGMVFLGVDTLSQSTQKVQHWGKKLPGWLKNANKDQVSRPIDHASDWLAVKQVVTKKP